jgi:hypothetical protein
MSFAPKDTVTVVRHYLDRDKLNKIADALGIQPPERDQIISAQIVIGPPQTPPSGRTAPPRGSRSRSPSGPRAPRRQSE